MTADVTDMLTNLRPLQPDAHNAQRVRARCLARLEQNHRRSRQWATMARVTRESAAPLLAAGLCVFYVAELVEFAARVFTS